MLNFSKVHMRYDKEILSDINITIKDGEFVSILGPSGCGKSTLLRLASNILTPSEGTITYNDDKELVIGFVFKIQH